MTPAASALAGSKTRKSVTARVQYMPVDSLTLGVSSYHDDLTAASKTAGSLSSIGAHAQWKSDSWKLLYEVARGRRRVPGAALTAKELGHVAEVGYALKHGITPYFQWETVNTELASTKERATAYIAGLDVPVGRHFVWKVQDAYWTGNGGNARFAAISGRKYNELNMAVFYAF